MSYLTEEMEKTINKLIELGRNTFFLEAYRKEQTPEHILGIAIARHFRVNGDSIFEVVVSAFEDANYHQFNEEIEKLWEKEP